MMTSQKGNWTIAMRKKTVTKRKSTKKVFILMHSHCGSLSQAQNSADDYNAQTSYSTMEAALADAGSVAESIKNDTDGPVTMFVAEVVQVGKPSGITWSADVTGK